MITNGMSQVSGSNAVYTCNAGYVSPSGSAVMLTCVGNIWVGGTPACGKSKLAATLGLAAIIWLNLM